MTAVSPKALVQAWVDAFNRGDIDALAALYAEDAVNHQVVQEPLVGRAIRFQRGYWDRLSFLRQQGLPLPTR
jgi:ketosteroid isomerase-like protein